MRVVFFMAWALVFAGCQEENPVEPPSEVKPRDFELTDVEGDTFRLSETQGKVVLLHFFAPWCPNCQDETAELNQLHAAYESEGLSIVSVAVQAENLEAVQAFVEEYDTRYRVLIDDGQVAAAGYGVTSTIPVSFVIDREVQLVGRYGGFLSEERLSEIIAPLL